MYCQWIVVNVNGVFIVFIVFSDRRLLGYRLVICQWIVRSGMSLLLVGITVELLLIDKIV